jgi:hypothetical protein
MPCVEITVESSGSVARLHAATSRPSKVFKKALRASPPPRFAVPLYAAILYTIGTTVPGGFYLMPK